MTDISNYLVFNSNGSLDSAFRSHIDNVHAEENQIVVEVPDFDISDSTRLYYLNDDASVSHTLKIEGMQFNYESKEWYDPRTLEDKKVSKWSQIKNQRDALEFGGFEFEGNVYDSDQTSQGRIMVAAMAQTDQVWTLADNTTISLSAAQLASLYITLQSHVADAHARGREARLALDAATTVEEINAVIF